MNLAFPLLAERAVLTLTLQQHVEGVAPAGRSSGSATTCYPSPTHRFQFSWDHWQYNQAGWDHNDQFLLPPHTSLTLGIQACWDPAATFLYSTCRLPILQCGTFLGQHCLRQSVASVQPLPMGMAARESFIALYGAVLPVGYKTVLAFAILLHFRSGGSLVEQWWLIGWSSGGSLVEQWWLIGWSSGGLLVEQWWLIGWSSGGSLVEQWWLIGGAVVAHWLELWWLIGGAVVAHWLEQWRLIGGAVVAHWWSSGGSFLEQWWLIGWSSGGSLVGAVMAHWLEQWWLIGWSNGGSLVE